MGCVCCSLSSFVSIVLNALERITLCTVCAALTCCLLFTILSVLVMGIGIGFHYCTVQNSVDAMEKAAQAAGALRSGAPQESPMMRSVNKAVKRGFAHRLGKRDQANEMMPSNNNTINDLLLFGRNNTDNDLILFGQNKNETSNRIKRDLRSVVTSNNNLNDKSVSNSTILNDTVHLYTEYEIKGNNASIYNVNDTSNNTILVQQNCTLLYFLSRLF